MNLLRNPRTFTRSTKRQRICARGRSCRVRRLARGSRESKRLGATQSDPERGASRPSQAKQTRFPGGPAAATGHVRMPAAVPEAARAGPARIAAARFDGSGSELDRSTRRYRSVLSPNSGALRLCLGLMDACEWSAAVTRERAGALIVEDKI